MAKIFVSRVIDAPADTVWQCVRDFNGMPDWHPAIADSEIEGGNASDAVGCVRSFHLADGAHLRERLTALSDVERAQSYAILDSPLPVTDYEATLSIVPITESDQSLACWRATFDVPADQAEATIDTVANGVFRTGLESLVQRFGAAR